MAFLHPFGATKKEYPQVISLYKNLSTIGSVPSCDLRLPVEKIGPILAHIRFDGEMYIISTTIRNYEITVGQKKAHKTNLVEGDLIEIEGFQYQFSLNEVLLTDKANTVAKDCNEAQEIQAYKQILDFSQDLGHANNSHELLEKLMDHVITLTQAERGFLVVLDEDEIQIKVARNIAGESLERAKESLSDTILNRVLESRESIIVSNALENQEFNSSLSVVNLRLSSVMCAPLFFRGKVFGAIYLGNNHIINLFEEQQLELLSIFCAQASLLLKSALHIDQLQAEKHQLKQELSQNRFGQIIGSSPKMQQLFKTIEKVAKANINVLITGETGTGKELVARELHRASPRSAGPFIVINCGAIPENLLESELFGHVKGAFTGANQNKIGMFQAADGGTLFLDEIGEMPLHLQVKILRALQEKEVTQVGATQSTSVDIRVLSATHRDLEKRISEQEFREDLYYRLNVINIQLPPLKERGEDVIVLGNYLVKKYATEFGSTVKGFNKKAQIALKKYRWPGNIRQLENRIKRAVVMCDSKLLSPKDLDINHQDFEEIEALSDAIDAFKARYIDEALLRNGNNRSQTAKELKVDPRTIFRHLETHKIEKTEV